MLFADYLLFEIELSRFGQCLNSKYSDTDYMQKLQILKMNRFGTNGIFHIIEHNNNLNQVEVSAWMIMQSTSSDLSQLKKCRYGAMEVQSLLAQADFTSFCCTTMCP